MAKQTHGTPSQSRGTRKIPGWLVISFGAVLVVVLAAFFSEFQFGGPAVGLDAGIKNVLLITFDTTRADRIGAYGYPKARSDNIDRLAKEGVLFERCITVAPITLPSHTSILTGMYPYDHGVRNNGTHNVLPEVTTLAERLDEKGFATGAVVSALVLDSRYGLDQGFHLYNDDLSAAEKAPLFMYRETKAQNTAERAIRWLQDRADERFFLWVHFFDPHANYQPPEPFASDCEDPYDGEIHYADSGMGEILEALRQRGVLDETLVIMTADHGESLGEHGEATHSLFIYDATTRVPLVMRHPALAQGKRVPLPVSSVDIAPTIMELLGFDPPADVDGESLAKAVLDRRAPGPDKEVYSESMNPYYNHGWSDTRAVRDKSYRYIRAPKPELYDLFRDGRELSNVHDKYPELTAHYSAILEAFLAGGEKDTRGEDIKSMSPEHRQALAELGYVWEDTHLPEPGDHLPDPKDMVNMWERSQRAHDLVRQKRLPEAEEALKQVLAEDPDATLTQSALVGVLLQLGKRDEAYELLRRVVTGPAPPVTTVLRLAGLEHEDGIETWSQHLEFAKTLAPRDPLPWVRQGDWAQQDGDTDAAIAAYERALEVDPQCAQGLIGLGNTYHRLKEEEKAEAALRKATEVDPLAFEAFYNLGVVNEAMKQPVEAEQWYIKALNVEKDHVLTLVNLGNLYFARATSEPGKISPQLVARAEGLYRKAVEVREEDFNANFNLGILLLRTAPLLKDESKRPERFKEAADAFGRCVAADPGRTGAWRNRLIACRNAGLNEEILEAARHVLEADPENVDARIFQAVAYERLEQPQQAEQILTAALTSDGDRVRQRGARDPELRDLLSRLGVEVQAIAPGAGVPMEASGSITVPGGPSGEGGQ